MMSRVDIVIGGKTRYKNVRSHIARLYVTAYNQENNWGPYGAATMRDTEIDTELTLKRCQLCDSCGYTEWLRRTDTP
jgi:hypothetical protein